MLQRRHLLGLTAATIGGLAAPSLVRAQTAWPNRSIRLVAQFPPGGLVDTVARLMAPMMAQALGQSVVVENRAGAGGIIGTDVVAKGPGRWLYAAGQPCLRPCLFDRDAAGAALRPDQRLHPHAAAGGGAEHHPGARRFPYQTLDQLVTAARTRPVRFGSSGIGSAPHLLGAMLSSEARAPNLDHIPYAGSAPAMQDLLARNIESMVDPITTNVQQMRDGSLKALAVSAPQRLAAFPDVPTFAELGFPKLTSAQWLGLSAPKGLPAPIVERLTTITPAILARPELMARFTDIQTMPRNPPPTGDAFVSIIRREITEWTVVARQFNIVVG
jgi:tripartite-type tricarboxylate transporter receptor subunit TctC